MVISPSFQIGSDQVGAGFPTYVIAEIGSNHNQSFDLACQSIEAAAIGGANAVKFQSFKADSHYSKYSPGFSYLDNQSTYNLIKSLELNQTWHDDLMKCAADNGVTFFSSPCDIQSVENLSKLNTLAYKVASFDLLDEQLVSHIASKGKPVILSTGMADLGEIQFAINAVKAQRNHQIALLQCTSLYPAPVSLSNLKAMLTLQQAFGVVCGYSDHTLGTHIALAAVARGASIIEKHFTLDRSLPGPDHQFAIEPSEFKQMMIHIRDVEDSIGSGLKAGPRLQELEMAQKGRRSIHAMTSIQEGQVITDNMICVKRPGLGISPIHRQLVVGRKALTNIEPDQWITWEMI